MFEPRTVVKTLSFSETAAIALEAARQGGDILLKYWNRLGSDQIHEKGRGDLVTAADLASEHEIAEFLNREMPEAAVICEEGTVVGGSGQVWYVDPLDGTTNFVQGIPIFAVSIALAADADRENADIRCGVVYNPVSGDLFTAEKGRGSFLGDRPLTGSKKKKLADAVIATGFPRRYSDELKPYLIEFGSIYPQCRAVRRMGAAALDLCWTAQGIFDGFWEHRLSPWDIGAGALIVEETGGICTDFAGKRSFLRSGDIIGAQPEIHREILEHIRQSRRFIPDGP